MMMSNTAVRTLSVSPALSPVAPPVSSDLDSGARQDLAVGSGLPQTLQQEFSLVNLQIRNVNVEVRHFFFCCLSAGSCPHHFVCVVQNKISSVDIINHWEEKVHIRNSYFLNH